MIKPENKYKHSNSENDISAENDINMNIEWEYNISNDNNQKLEQYYEDQYCNQLEQEGMSFIIKLRKETKLYRKKYKSSECKKEIWIINDEKDKAGDNGEYFFRYLKVKKPNGIKIYFAIDKNNSQISKRNGRKRI